MNGWIKLHRKILDNEMLWADSNAFVVFVKLLVLVDRGTGDYRTGRFAFAELVQLKPTTAYQVLKRLEKHQMVTLRSNNKYTVIHICNWSKYQGEDDSPNDNQMTTRRQPDDNAMTLNKNKELRIKNKENISRVSNETATRLNELYELYLTEFETTAERFKLTPARKVKLRARVKDAGFDLVAQAIRNTAASAFHRGENERGWRANLDFIIRSYEQIEKLAALDSVSTIDRDAEELRKKWMTT